MCAGVEPIADLLVKAVKEQFLHPSEIVFETTIKVQIPAV